ncbi:MAG: hypothetical protein ABI429_10065 [Jatrophihabitantaceae bacterium]
MWADPDAAGSHHVAVGPWTAIIAAARPGHAQSFYVMITNRSSVTQTILGRTDDGAESSESEHLAVALPTGAILSDQAEPSTQHYSSTKSRTAQWHPVAALYDRPRGDRLVQ